jgi:hypothetical protein
MPDYFVVARDVAGMEIVLHVPADTLSAAVDEVVKKFPRCDVVSAVNETLAKQYGLLE